MPKELTIKDFHRIGLEVQSHTGLPYLKSDYYIWLLLALTKLGLIQENIDPTNTIVNKVMQYYHFDKKKKHINPNVKSYDWC